MATPDRGAAALAVLSRATGRIVEPLLTSRAAFLVTWSFMRLHYTGRRSGREITLIVNYRLRAEDGAAIVAVGYPASKTWWRNFDGDGAAASWSVRGRPVQGWGRVQRAGNRVRVVFSPGRPG